MKNLDRFATFERVNGFWVGTIKGVTQKITYKTEKACRKWTAHYIANHTGKKLTPEF